jgi:hypothetical protein
MAKRKRKAQQRLIFEVPIFYLNQRVSIFVKTVVFYLVTRRRTRERHKYIFLSTVLVVTRTGTLLLRLNLSNPVACFLLLFTSHSLSGFPYDWMCAGLAMGAIPVGGFAPYMVPHSQALIHNEANSLLPIQNLLRSPGRCKRKPTGMCRVLERYQKKIINDDKVKTKATTGTWYIIMSFHVGCSEISETSVSDPDSLILDPDLAIWAE